MWKNIPWETLIGWTYKSQCEEKYKEKLDTYIDAAEDVICQRAQPSESHWNLQLLLMSVTSRSSTNNGMKTEKVMSPLEVIGLLQMDEPLP
jgi:hypothetical protein